MLTFDQFVYTRPDMNEVKAQFSDLLDRLRMEEAGHLPDKLQRGRPDLFFRGRRVEVKQRLNIAAHMDQLPY